MEAYRKVAERKVGGKKRKKKDAAAKVDTVNVATEN